MLLKEQSPMRVLGFAQPHDIIDLIEVEGWFSITSAVVHSPPRIELPSIGLLGAIVRNGAGNSISANEVDVAQIGKMHSQALRHRGGNRSLMCAGTLGLADQIQKMCP